MAEQRFPLSPEIGSEKWILKPGGRLVITTPHNENIRVFVSPLVRRHYWAFCENSTRAPRAVLIASANPSPSNCAPECLGPRESANQLLDRRLRCEDIA